MVDQTLPIADNLDDGYDTTSSWNASGFGGAGIIFCGTGEGGGASFVLTAAIPSGSTAIAMRFRIRNRGADDSGSSTMRLETESANPTGLARFSGTKLPSSVTTLRSRNIGPVTWADGYYFGASDTLPQNLVADLQDLINTYAGLEVGDRINI